MSCDQLIHRLFFQWGYIAHRFRLLLFLLPIAMTMLMAVGFVWIKQLTTNDPQYVFSPEVAPWRYERGVLSEHWPLDEQHFWPGKSYDYNGYVDVVAAGKRDGEGRRPNMLLKQYINELDRVNQVILHNITIPVLHNGKLYDIGYLDLCMSYEWKCYQNDHITMLMPKHKWGDFNEKIKEFVSDIIEREVHITYPIAWRGTEPLYLGALVGKPHLIDEDGHFDYVRAVRMTYNLREEKIGNVSYLWRKRLTDYLSNKYGQASELLEFGLNHNESLPDGLQEVADSLTPRFAMTVTILFTFCMLSSVVLMRHDAGNYIGIDWVRSKPLLAIAGMFCPLLAIVSAFGSILWCGGWYNAIVNVSPFIVICVGVDDMFIMAAAWHRTNPQLSVQRRMAEAMAEAAVAITITSLTDVLSFGIGCVTTLPGVRMFCMYTAMGILFTYIYQLTFFTAVMAFCGEQEARGKHSLLLTRALNPDAADNWFKRYFLTGVVLEEKMTIENVTVPSLKSTPETIEPVNCPVKVFNEHTKQHDQDIPSWHDRETFVSKLFREYYGPFLLAPSTKLAILLIYIIYLAFAVFGCTQIQEGVNPKFLVKETFYLAKFYQLMDETFFDEGLQMQVVINRPPDLFNQTERDIFSDMMNRFENSPYTMKHNATMFWLTAFEAKLNDDFKAFNHTKPTTSLEWYARCREWLLSAGGRRLWEKDMVWGKNHSDPSDYNHLYAFRLQLGLRNYRTPTDHTESAMLMRNIAAAFPMFNVTTFHEYYPFVDQYIELKPSLLRNCALAIVCMAIVSLMLIPNIGAAFAIIAAIFSIDIGVIGYMTFWGVRLESVSIITVIMSIGFAVDLSAHIAYAYVKAIGRREQKVIQALETLGWPVFLGAFSTVVGIMALATVDAYIIQIFFKTTFLVICFSMLHGLVFLPILLTIVLPHASFNETNKTEQHNDLTFGSVQKNNNVIPEADLSTPTGMAITGAHNRRSVLEEADLNEMIQQEGDERRSLEEEEEEEKKINHR